MKVTNYLLYPQTSKGRSKINFALLELVNVSFLFITRIQGLFWKFLILFVFRCPPYEPRVDLSRDLQRKLRQKLEKRKNLCAFHTARVKSVQNAFVSARFGDIRGAGGARRRDVRRAGQRRPLRVVVVQVPQRMRLCGHHGGLLPPRTYPGSQEFAIGYRKTVST